MNRLNEDKNILLAFKITDAYKIEELYAYFKFLSSEVTDQIKRFYFERDKLRCFYGHMLLRYGLKKITGRAPDKLEYNYNKYGKPSLTLEDNFCFNLSHSGEWVVCGFSEDDVGIDVELVKAIDYKIVDAFFSKKEICFFNSLTEEEKKERFFDFWTLKESFIKNIGKGLSYKLNEFSIIFDKDISVEIKEEKDSNYFFKQYHLDSQHKLAICLKNDKFPCDILFVKCEELLI